MYFWECVFVCVVVSLGEWVCVPENMNETQFSHLNENVVDMGVL